MNSKLSLNCFLAKHSWYAALAAAGLWLTPGSQAGETGVAAATARSGPDWLRAGTIYEVFPRDFSPRGDLDGVTAQLDRLKDLGVTIVWTMPIHPIGEKARKGVYGSPYSIRDFYAVDASYGTLDDYRRLVSEAHQRGMKVIMDLVANHTAWDSVMRQHDEFYKHDAQGKVIAPEPDWSDVAGLNYRNQALRQYMIAMLKFWVQTCDVDGFRCDSAAMVPTEFWEQARAALVAVKPDIMMLAEASKPELLTNAFDIDYSWPLMGALNHVLAHNAPASEIRKCWDENLREFPQGALHLRISDDHDEVRAVNQYGLHPALAASALMFTLDGVPLLYNGMEIGDTGESAGGSLFEKLPIAWSSPDRPALAQTYHDLIQLRHQYAALRASRVDWLPNSDERNVVTFLRADDKDELLVVINFSGRPVAGTVDLKSADGFAPVNISGMKITSNTALPAFHLSAFEWGIYHRAVK